MNLNHWNAWQVEKRYNLKPSESELFRLLVSWPSMVTGNMGVPLYCGVGMLFLLEELSSTRGSARKRHQSPFVSFPVEPQWFRCGLCPLSLDRDGGCFGRPGAMWCWMGPKHAHVSLTFITNLHAWHAIFQPCPMAEMSFTSDLPLPLPSSALSGEWGSLCHGSKLDVQVERKGNDGTRMCAQHVDKSFRIRAQTPTHFNACQFIFIHVIMYCICRLLCYPVWRSTARMVVGGWCGCLWGNN